MDSLKLRINNKVFPVGFSNPITVLIHSDENKDVTRHSIYNSLIEILDFTNTEVKIINFENTDLPNNLIGKSNLEYLSNVNDKQLTDIEINVLRDVEVRLDELIDTGELILEELLRNNNLHTNIKRKVIIVESIPQEVWETGSYISEFILKNAKATGVYFILTTNTCTSKYVPKELRKYEKRI